MLNPLEPHFLILISEKNRKKLAHTFYNFYTSYGNIDFAYDWYSERKDNKYERYCEFDKFTFTFFVTMKDDAINYKFKKGWDLNHNMKFDFEILDSGYIRF